MIVNRRFYRFCAATVRPHYGPLGVGMKRVFPSSIQLKFHYFYSSIDVSCLCEGVSQPVAARGPAPSLHEWLVPDSLRYYSSISVRMGPGHFLAEIIAQSLGCLTKKNFRTFPYSIFRQFPGSWLLKPAKFLASLTVDYR